MTEEDRISDEKYEKIKKYIPNYSYVDLVIWRNEMITSGVVNNRLFRLLNDEIERRAKEVYHLEQQRKHAK